MAVVIGLSGLSFMSLARLTHATRGALVTSVGRKVNRLAIKTSADNGNCD